MPPPGQLRILPAAFGPRLAGKLEAAAKPCHSAALPDCLCRRHHSRDWRLCAVDWRGHCRRAHLVAPGARAEEQVCARLPLRCDQALVCVHLQRTGRSGAWLGEPAAHSAVHGFHLHHCAPAFAHPCLPSAPRRTTRAGTSPTPSAHSCLRCWFCGPRAQSCGEAGQAWQPACFSSPRHGSQLAALYHGSGTPKCFKLWTPWAAPVPSLLSPVWEQLD